MGESEAPLILEFEIRPEFHRPTRLRVAVELGGSALLIGLTVWAWVAGGVPLGVLAVIGGIVATILLVCGVIDLVHHQSWRREIDEALELLNKDGACASDNALNQIRRGVVLRYWRRIGKEGRMVQTLRESEIQPPRAVLIGSPRWTRKVGRSVSPDLVEPEFIRSRVSGLGLARLAPRLIINGLVIAWIFLVGFQLIRSTTQGFGWGFAIVGVLILASLAYFIRQTIHKRGYTALGGAGLIAGPSRVEVHGSRSMRAWTACDTIMLVHRTRPRSRGLSVDLISDGSAGSYGRETFHFFGPNDPGFKTLWAMWIHPREVDLLMEE